MFDLLGRIRFFGARCPCRNIRGEFSVATSFESSSSSSVQPAGECGVMIVSVGSIQPRCFCGGRQWTFTKSSPYCVETISPLPVR